MEMEPSLRDLVPILLRHRGRGTPCVLLLGKEMGEAAGAPTKESMAREAFLDLSKRDMESARHYLDGETLAMILNNPDMPVDTDKLINAFNALLGGMSGLARYSFLQRFTSNLPVPRFYQDLARLVRNGYFANILTTNLDTLIEEALSGIGLRRSVDFRTIQVGADYYIKKRLSGDYAATPITIFRLSSDVTGREQSIPPEDLDAALRTGPDPARDQYADMISVGYHLESPPINVVLRNIHTRLWLVSEVPPEGELENLNSVRPVIPVSGDSGRPDRFFGLLNTLLSIYEQPESDVRQEQMQEDLGLGESFGVPGEEDEGGALPPVEVVDPGSPEFEWKYLQDQLRRARTALSNLEKQQAVQGKSATNVQVQISYQLTEIYELENRLREMETTGQKLMGVVSVIVQQAETGGVDRDTVLFLRYQARAIKKEYDKPQPNQDVITAAVSAVAVLAERLTPAVVDPELLEELNTSFLPSTVNVRSAAQAARK